jgi:tetratricopeptide (TPR) repeat protein
MKENHPDQDMLIRFRRGELAPEDERETERHLSRCASCREKADEIETLTKLDILESWLHPGYDEAIERAADRVSARLTDLLGETRETELLLMELFRQPAPERRVLVRRNPRFHGIKLCQRLEARSREMWFSDPVAALENAELAVEIAERLDSVRYGSSLVEDARATAWGYLGNSYRVSSDLWKAEQAFRKAWVHHVQAGEDPYTEGELLSFIASLRDSQSRVDEATRALDRAVAIYREGQDRVLESAALIKKGSSLGYSGQFRRALRLIRKGLRLLDSEGEPRLVLAGWHNMINFINDSGMPSQALRILERKRPLYEEFGEPLHRVRLQWLEGKILRDLNSSKAAEIALSQAKEELVDRELSVDAAFLSLDIALLYARQGFRAGIREVTAEIIPLFDTYKLVQESLMARLLFERAP